MLKKERYLLFKQIFLSFVLCVVDFLSDHLEPKSDGLLCSKEKRCFS